MSVSVLTTHGYFVGTFDQLVYTIENQLPLNQVLELEPFEEDPFLSPESAPLTRKDSMQPEEPKKKTRKGKRKGGGKKKNNKKHRGSAEAEARAAQGDESAGEDEAAARHARPSRSRAEMLEELANIAAASSSV